MYSKGNIKMRRLCKKSFTMAEILLSLTIIGVVAAITLPSLTGNINERTWNTQKRAVYARMSQGMALVSSLNESDTASDFITTQLSKVLKINNICDRTHLDDCGINSAMLINATGGPYNGTGSFPSLWNQLGFSMTGSATGNRVSAFETQNGESIVLFYNPDCTPDMEFTSSNYTIMNSVCINMIYDLNSAKGPNTAGKDVGFMTVYYPSDPSVVHPEFNINTTAMNACPDDYRIPNLLEAASMVLNNRLIAGSTAAIPSSTQTMSGADTYYWQADVNSNTVRAAQTTTAFPATTTTRCVKR